jgi:hypothetical protein
VTKFVVLRRRPTAANDPLADETWVVQNESVDAPTPAAAVAAVAAASETPGVYAAVPARSWHVLDVEMETRPKAIARERAEAKP